MNAKKKLMAKAEPYAREIFSRFSASNTEIGSGRYALLRTLRVFPVECHKFGCDATGKVSTIIYSKVFLHERVCHFNEIATQKVDADSDPHKKGVGWHMHRQSRAILVSRLDDVW